MEPISVGSVLIGRRLLSSNAYRSLAARPCCFRIWRFCDRYFTYPMLVHVRIYGVSPTVKYDLRNISLLEKYLDMLSCTESVSAKSLHRILCRFCAGLHRILCRSVEKCALMHIMMLYGTNFTPPFHPANINAWYELTECEFRGAAGGARHQPYDSAIMVVRNTNTT